MIKDKIIVPRGIRYIGEWGDFRFNKFPSKCIINKQLPGCGFTEYCIGGPENVILCSPRKMLLENKKDQHEEDIYLVVNEMEKEVEVDKDLTKEPRNVKLEEDEGSIILPTYFLCGLMDTMVGQMRGMGYSIVPMIVSLTGACLLRIVWLYTFFAADPTLNTLYISYPISWGTTFLIHFLCYLYANHKMPRTAPDPTAA